MIIAFYVAGILYHGLLGHRNHLTISDMPTNHPMAMMGSIQFGLLVPGKIPKAGSIPNKSIAPIAAGVTAVKAIIRDMVSFKALARSLYIP